LPIPLWQNQKPMAATLDTHARAELATALGHDNSIHTHLTLLDQDLGEATRCGQTAQLEGV